MFRSAPKQLQQQCRKVLSWRSAATPVQRTVAQHKACSIVGLPAQGLGWNMQGYAAHAASRPQRRFLSEAAPSDASASAGNSAEETRQTAVRELLAPENAAEHAGEHVAKFYQPSAGTARTLLSTVDNNLGKRIDRNGIHELALMIRRPSVDIVNVLKAADADGSQPPPRIVISGPSGTGKSLGLLHIADFCRAQGWAVAFIPDAPAWVDTEQTIMESVRDKERMDQNVLSAEWLSVFLKWNKELLANTMVNDGYNWDANAKGFTTDGMTLEGMAEVGIEDNRFACDMVGILLKQLVAISAETPMLLAMDGYNSWLKPQYDNFQDITLKPLDIDRASLVRHFAKLMLTANKGGLQRGGIVLVESLNHVEQNKVEQDKLLESSMRVQYGDFTSKEFRSYLDYHEATGWIHRGINNTNAEILAQMTKRNPKKLDDMLKTL